jgi:GGDEF domain-containing protein
VEGEVARVGPAELAALVTCQTPAGARDVCANLERDLAESGCRATFGWAFHPADGADALSLLRAADERLYARLLVRGEWNPPAASAELVAELPPARTSA